MLPIIHLSFVLGCRLPLVAIAIVLSPTAQRRLPKMREIANAIILSIALLKCAISVPVGPENLTGRSLLGSSFGVPGNQTFDYVIVGGGTAGLALANRLSENPSFSVALIEAGSFYEIGNGNLSQIPLDVPVGLDKTMQNYNPVVDWGDKTIPQIVSDQTSSTSLIAVRALLSGDQ